MDLTPIIPIAAIGAFTVLRLAKLKVAHLQALPGVSSERLDALEREVQELQQQLAETQERLDFAERMLTKGRDERGLGG